MKRVASLLVLVISAVVVLEATQIYKGSYASGKQRKPSLPKKYLVEDGGYIKHRKIRALISEHELRERHRVGRQLPGVRNGGGGYLYNRPVYTSSDHLAARPALPLTEVESHPLSNFPAHYTGDLEDEPKKDASKSKTPSDSEKPSAPANVTVKDGAIPEDGKVKEQPDQTKKVEPIEPEVLKQEVSQDKSEPVAIAVPASAVVPVGKNMQSEQDLDKLSSANGEKSGAGGEPPMIVSQQGTVSGKPPVAME
ncbi:uncharacterized protein LOC111273976 [Varroa jacobsoni]|uniref:Uncharacterized protein n=1 Tax=Varroa destructor TaxID=109461 RepID=A0A7M7J5Z3_VARDE|nr:uncharacterized protein LOC111244443 [Varroa destructor]XP_022647332.1 uncharacterized protein LOC111244443 [Varroa destructor]XP_022711759.1 uncharacterized protein LOC111273976 [Varroa jacobsoni]